MAGPWEKYGGAAPAAGDPVIAPPDPYKQAAEQRAQQDQVFQSEAAQRAREDQARQAEASARDAERLRLAQENAQRQAKQSQFGNEGQSKAAGFLERAIGANKVFEETGVGPRSVIGEYVAQTAPTLKNLTDSPERQRAVMAQRDFIASVLRLESGAAISQSEFDNYAKLYFPQPGDAEDTLQAKAEARRRAMDALKHQAGPGGESLEIPGPPPGPANVDASAPAPQSFTPSTGDQRLANDPQTQAQLEKMLRAGAPLAAVNQFLAKQGDMPLGHDDYTAVRGAIAKGHPYNISAQRYEPNTAFEKTVTKLGSGAAGAYAIGAGQMLSGGTLDNMTSDPERARMAMNISAAQNPTANTLGQISGGVMAGLVGEAGLARAGMAAGIGRSALADAAMGGANGAGNADNGGRVANAMLGAATGAAGSVAGSAVMKGAANALAPTGGALKALYESGVRPSVGQRFANSNGIGKAINATEEKLQSVPIIGDAIKGTRNAARDQFQIGAFNQALGEVGEQLPKGMKPGTDPHKFAQKVFDRAYSDARAGMHVVADSELKNDLGGLFQQVGMLAQPSQARFKAIADNVVMRRLQNGNLTGDAYKAAYSDLGKQIRGIRNSPTGDGELADALQGLQDTLDSAARRHSNPDAVALLDAADAGYAKLVRIEEAAKRRGGDQGTFSPLQFDSAVQKEGGGTRSKAFLRGDALMQDYAQAGRSLGDYTPNSGTVDRGLAAGLALGAGKVAPPVALGLGAIGLANAPGVRKLTTGAMAPSGPAAQRIAARLKARARLVGAIGAASAVEALPGTTPGQ